MIDQEFVDAHAERIDDLSEVFEKQLSRSVEVVVAAVASILLNSLSVENGWVASTPSNAKIIRSIDASYSQALKTSDYYSITQAFVGLFVSQVEEFSKAYAVDAEQNRILREFFLTAADREILENQVGVAILVLDGRTLDVSYDLRQLSSKSLGGVLASDLIIGVSDIIRKLAKVEQIAKDQLTTFFRLVGNLVYSNVENRGFKVLYKYVGPRDDRNRKFCGDLLDSSEAYSREEIDQMDNGQIPGVFENGGGYGCRHWFSLWSVAA